MIGPKISLTNIKFIVSYYMFKNIGHKELKKVLATLVKDSILLLSSVPRLPRKGYKLIITFPTNLIPSAVKSLEISNNGNQTFNLDFNY